MYCGPPTSPCLAAGGGKACAVGESEYVGFGDRIETWDGRMWDGTFVFDFDRCVC